MTPHSNFTPFLRESNGIEGIYTRLTNAEIENFAEFYRNPISFESACWYQKKLEPTKPLRTEPGMNVQVGSHIAPPGGPEIGEALREIIRAIGFQKLSPYEAHCEFLTLHPFMDGNGRTARAIWARQMRGLGLNPFALPFLQTFYYQALSAADGRK